MKKLICLILSAIMVFSLATPVFAESKGKWASVENETPVIYISGDSQGLSYDNGTKTFAIEDMIDIFGDNGDGNISEAAFNILFPFVMKGILNDDWDDYYKAVYDEISQAYAPVLLDKNGEPATDCGLSAKLKAYNAESMVVDRKTKDGRYTERGYQFYYDWRLDPIELADELNIFIEGVKKVTGHDKVSLSVKCLGCNVALAYIDKYGTDSLKGIGFDVATSMGAEFISGMVSGKFGLDGNSISRVATYMSEREMAYTDVARVATSILDLLDNTGVLDAFNKELREKIYSKIEYGIVSALALSTFMTYPCYWALVTLEDFDNALFYVFGEEGSEKREEYKGLIEKITYYNEKIKKNVLPIMKSVEEAGVNICVVSKYGVQMVPVLKGGTTYLGDEYVSAYRSSFGATTGTVYETLSDEYIAQRVAEGKGKYISPDNQIDASTCLFPDYTWFFKGEPHGFYCTEECDLIMNVIDADRQLTIDDFDWTQFISYAYIGRKASPMTKDNCNTEYWEADEKIDHPQTKNEKIFSLIKSAIRVLVSLVNFIKERLFVVK